MRAPGLCVCAYLYSSLEIPVCDVGETLGFLVYCPFSCVKKKGPSSPPVGAAFAPGLVFVCDSPANFHTLPKLCVSPLLCATGSEAWFGRVRFHSQLMGKLPHFLLVLP